MTVTTNNFIEQNVLITGLYNLTSGQRNLMKGHITPTLVTPAEGEFILKPRFRHDTLSPADLSLPLRTILQPLVAAYTVHHISVVAQPPKLQSVFNGHCCHRY